MDLFPVQSCGVNVRVHRDTQHILSGLKAMTIKPKGQKEPHI